MPIETTIELDPGTICARSHAGEAELVAARSGLPLPQRKLLSLIVAPRVFAELVAENRLEPLRAARDLARLADLGLIVLHGPAARGARVVRQAPSPIAADPLQRPMNPGARGVAKARPPRIALIATLVIVMILAWILFGGSATTPASPRAADSNAAAPAARPILGAGNPAPAAFLPTPTAIARESPLPAARERPPDPPRSPGPATTGNRPTDAPGADAPRSSATGRLPDPAPETAAGVPPPATTVATAAPPVPPASAAAAALPEPPPVAMALVTPTPIVPLLQDPARSALRPTMRESPVFPREALAAGVTSGSVTARVTVAATGKVIGVDIVDSQPRKLFDRAVRSALERWQFEPGTETRTTEIEIAFSRD
jgi:protein TonB